MTKPSLHTCPTLDGPRSMTKLVCYLITCGMLSMLLVLSSREACMVSPANITYSQSILTPYVNPADYPAANFRQISTAFKLYWKLLRNEKSSNINDAILEFGVTVTGITGYIGLCFGITSDPMRGDTMFGYVTANGEPTIVDAWMTNEPNPPKADASDDFIQRNGGSRIVNGVRETSLKWTRFVKTNDTLDYTFPNANIRLSWAYHRTSTSMVEHTSQGSAVTANFLATGFATGEYGQLPQPPVIGQHGNSSNCSLPSTYAQSIMTQFVNPSDYPSANAQVMGTYGTGDSLTLYWKRLTNPGTGGDILEFAMVATGIYGYASVAFNHAPSSGMQTADTIFGYIDTQGNPVIIDAYMQGNLQAPTVDAKQNIIMKNGGIRQVNGRYEVHLKWTRLADTKDTADHTFTNAQIPCSWAVSKSGTSLNSPHSYRDKNVMINFMSSPALTQTSPPPGSSLATCGSNSTNSDLGSLVVGDLSGANVYRWHLIVTGIICGALVICGFLLSVVAPRVNPNLFFDLILYRRFTKLVTVKYLGQYFTNVALDLTVGELIVISCYWILIIVWFIYGFIGSSVAPAGKAFASVCVFNFGLILFPVTRYSVLQVLFGVSFDRAIKFHRWLGILQWWYVTAHGVAMVGYYYGSDTYLVSLASPSYPILGIIAWFFMSCLWLMTFPAIRRKLWEVFLISHIILSILVVIFSVIHGSGYINLLPYMGLSIAFYLFDVLLRVVFGFGVPTQLVSMQYNEHAEVTTITMRKPFLTFGSNPSHGHFIFLYIPGVSLYQHHPATVSSCKTIESSSKQKELEFTVHIRNFNSGWSLKVAKVAKEQAELRRNLPANESKLIKFCRVEGAYGNLSVPLFQYKTIVLIAGGIGVTPVNAIYSDLLEKYSNTATKRVYYSWSIRSEEMIELFPALTRDGGKHFHPHIYVSRKPKDLEKHDPRIHYCRANPKEFLEMVKKQLKEQYGCQEGQLEYVGVLVCGPEQLITSVSNAVWDCNERNGIRFHLHKETFTW
ncbi:hypothetical protein C9374_005039 [Naegleria lovaniensis]|uniref:DOMON domain-containing protein n=1 Tax=Naegleria lovaniensis TaxID=51637 RepID=A0AA88KI49_NAELO|nr:uncharacterized protein C9374_005039 [Naegleria lovaniensis]KAG2382459.1 hypothetical protein C9374_005039 [Naegleria lovaniensis]